MSVPLHVPVCIILCRSCWRTRPQAPRCQRRPHAWCATTARVWLRSWLHRSCITSRLGTHNGNWGAPHASCTPPAQQQQQQQVVVAHPRPLVHSRNLQCCCLDSFPAVICARCGALVPTTPPLCIIADSCCSLFSFAFAFAGLLLFLLFDVFAGVGLTSLGSCVRCDVSFSSYRFLCVAILCRRTPSGVCVALLWLLLTRIISHRAALQAFRCLCYSVMCARRRLFAVRGAGILTLLLTQCPSGTDSISRLPILRRLREAGRVEPDNNTKNSSVNCATVVVHACRYTRDTQLLSHDKRSITTKYACGWLTSTLTNVVVRSCNNTQRDKWDDLKLQQLNGTGTPALR